MGLYWSGCATGDVSASREKASEDKHGRTPPLRASGTRP
jgi:hypothetical protein